MVVNIYTFGQMISFLSRRWELLTNNKTVGGLDNLELSPVANGRQKFRYLL